MANLTKPNLGFSPNRGRAALDKIGEELAYRGRQIATSRPFVAFVIVVALVLGVYYFVLAAPIYVSQTSFTIRGREQPSVGAGLLASLGGGGGGGGGGDGAETAELEKYVQSQGMLEKLDQRFDLRSLYSQPRLDPLKWMPHNASREKFLHFYRDMVQIRTEPNSDIITIEVHSFDPLTAQRIANAVLEISADYLNDLSAVVRKETLHASEQDLKDAEEAVRQSRLAMTQYRTTTGMLDPVAVASARSASMIGMQEEVLASRAELASLQTYNTPQAPQVMQLRARVAALESQIAQAQNDIAGPKRSNTLAQKLLQYEGLTVTNDYNEKQLLSALASYDSARSLASQRERFLVRVISPNMPDRPTLPHRLQSFLEALIVLVAGYGIVALAIAGVRDHQGI